MHNEMITFNNDGIHESCETVIFDDSRVEIGDLLFVLRNIRKHLNARIQLMEHAQFQLIKVSDDLFTLAPVGWEGYDTNETDINAGADRPAGDHHDDTESEPECPRVREQTNHHAPRCCAH